MPSSWFKPAGLRGHRLFESFDPDDARAQIATVMQDSTLRPGTGWRGGSARMDHVRLDGMSLSTLAYPSTMEVCVDELADYYLILLCLNGYAEIGSGARRTMIGQNRGIICSPRAHLAARFSADCEQFLLRIDRSAMALYSGFDQIELDSVLDLSRPALQPWMQQVQLLASSPEMIAAARSSRAVAAGLERLLVSLLLAAQPFKAQARRGQPGSGTPGGALPRAVRRAEEYIAEHACEPLRLGDIAKAAGVPARTLLDGFKKVRDSSPMAMVRETRMTRARQKLLDASEGGRVTDIALECGFVNLGRFASQYQQRFGETPSDTLKRRCLS